MEEENEKTLTLKSLEKIVNERFKEYDRKIAMLERHLHILKRAIGGKE